MSVRGSKGAAGAAVFALAVVAAITPSARASTAFSWGEMEIDGWLTVKTFQVTAEATHAQDGPDPVGAPAPPSVGSSTHASGSVDVCLIADSYVESGTVRTHVREKACPVRTDGFRYHPETFEAVVAGTVKTQLWTQRWEVVGGRWVIVNDKTVTRSASVNLRWRWSESPQVLEPRSCGQGGSASGFYAPATVTGTISFKGAGVTARPRGVPGVLRLGACANPG